MKHLVSLFFSLLAALAVLTAAFFSLPSFASALTLRGVNGRVIDGQSFSGECLRIVNSSNITVRNSTFTNCSNVAIGIIGNSSNITIENNRITNVRNNASRSGQGVLFQGLGRTTSNVKIRNNVISRTESACIQFSGVHGAGHEITKNQCLEILGIPKFRPDMISMYASSGTAASPIRITGNYLHKGGPHTSTAGISLGDHDGGYILVQHNTLVDAGSWALGIAGGHHITVDSNLVFMANASWSSFGPLAVGIRAQYNRACYSNTLRNNFVKVMPGAGLFRIHDGPQGGGECGPVAGFSGSSKSTSDQFPGYLTHRHTSPERDTNCWNCSKVATVTANSCLCQSNCPAGTTIVYLLGRM